MGNEENSQFSKFFTEKSSDFTHWRGGPNLRVNEPWSDDETPWIMPLKSLAKTEADFGAGVDARMEAEVGSVDVEANVEAPRL